MNLLILGLGYSASHHAHTRGASYARVSATVRSSEKRDALRAQGVDAHVFAPDTMDDTLRDVISQADRLLVSIPPGASGDPALARGPVAGAAPSLHRLPLHHRRVWRPWRRVDR